LQATTQADSQSTKPGRAVQAAYATNCFPENQTSFDSYVLHSLDTDLLATGIITTECLAYASSDADAVTRPDLPFASFGSQSWDTSQGSYLDFPSRLAYEPAGESISEPADHLEQLNHPPQSQVPLKIVRSRSDRPRYHLTRLQTPTLYALEQVLIRRSLPKSPLKRRGESGTSSTRSGGSTCTKRQQVRDTRGAELVRRVSIERMSGQAPASPDEGSTSSNLLGGRKPANKAAAASSRGKRRQPTGSTPRAAMSQPSGPPQSPIRPSQGNREPSAHPPSVLPREKVFPIQIGSELFRLSGASISSDGTHFCPL